MRTILLVHVFIAGLVSAGYAQTSSKGIFESPYDLGVSDPNTFYDNDTTYIPYRALGAEEFAVLIYGDDGKIVHRYVDLRSASGVVKVMPYTLKAGTYTCALAVNGRVGIRKGFIVLDPASRPASSSR